MEPVIQFSVVITVQLIVFLFFLQRHKEEVWWKPLRISFLVGVPFGIVFDYVIGFYAGVYDYVLGFTLGFLFWNGLLSFGLMMAKVWLLRAESLLRFYLHIIAIAVPYEIINYFFPVWRWTFFSQSWQEYMFVIFLAYFGLAFMMAAVLHYCCGVRFAMFTLVRK